MPLQNFFSHVEVETTARYRPGKDSFALQLRLRYLLDEDINIEKARVRVTSTTGETNREIWLESAGAVAFKKGIVRIVVQSNVSL